MTRTVWIFHHYADPPDGHWTGTYDLYRPLADKGHRITIFSSSFSHYTRREERLRDGEWLREQEYGGIRFVFLRTTPYERNDWRRTANMVSYGIRAYRAGRRRQNRPDIVIGATPHPFCIVAAALIAQRTRARFFLELHDLWLDYMIDTGMIRASSPAAIALRAMDRWCYRRAERILALWPGMGLHLSAAGIPADRMTWTPMGVNLRTMPVAENQPKNGKFRVVCTARFGPASNIDEILEAAELLQQAGDRRVEFVLVGGGPEEGRLRAYAQTRRLENVQFTGMVPKSEIPGYLRLADVCVAGLPDVPTYRRYGTIPSKIIDYLTAGRPVIFISSLETSVVALARAGRVVAPGDPRKLADAIVELASLPRDELVRLGLNGQDYIRQNHDIHRLAQRIEDLF